MTTGGRGQYGHVKIRLYPGEPGMGHVFEDNIIGDAIPKKFIAAIDDDDRTASVRAPRTPPPTVNDFGIALPEPDDDLET